MCGFSCCRVQSVISSKLYTKKQPFNWSDPKGGILAQGHWLELLSPALHSRCCGPSAGICQRLVETREFPRPFITRDYYVCFSVVHNTHHFRKRAHLLLVAGELALPFFPVSFLTLSALGPSAVLFHPPFGCVSPSSLLVLSVVVCAACVSVCPVCLLQQAELC